MATFQEVFDEMLRRLEQANKIIEEKDMIIEELEMTIANLEHQLDRFKKEKKKKNDNIDRVPSNGVE